MHEVSAVNQRAAGAAALPQRSAGATPGRREAPQTDGPDDRVELSGSAAARAAAAADEQAQAARIAEIRARIADGTYLTPEKLDAVVERLFAELREP